MANIRRRVNSESNGVLRHEAENEPVNDMQMPGVDFENLNFEQRRAPYNSGHRFINDLEEDARFRRNDDNNHKHK